MVDIDHQDLSDVSPESSSSTWCIDLPDAAPVSRGNSRWSLPSYPSSSSPERPKPPEAHVVPYSLCTWDFFLSHKQSNAQDAVSNLRMEISERVPCSFWLDIEQDPTVHGMCHGVCHSKNFLLFLTSGVTASKFCQMEMRWALQAEKNMILVSETDERHGKPDIGELIEKCPEDLKVIFEDNVIIPWYRDPELKSVCVTKILKQCVFEVDAERDSITDKLQRPLMFCNNDELVSLASSDVESVKVIDSSFVFFTSVWGIALPGASKLTRFWAICVTFLVLACGALCFSRFFHQRGPTWLDSWTLLQNVAAHPVVFILLQVVLSILRSDLILDLLDHHIDCRKAQAESLRIRTRISCGFVWILTFLVSAATWWGYLPGFLHPDYIGALGNDELPNHRFFFAIAHSFAYTFVLPIMYGSGLSAVLILVLIQELCFMAFATNLQRLNPDINSQGVDAAVASASMYRVEDGELARFKIGFLKTWQLQKKIQRQIAIPYMLFWLCQLAALPWSVNSLWKGFTPDFSDPRLENLRHYDHLQVRAWAQLVGSPWFGLPTWIFGFYPWLPIYYHWRFFNITKQLIFAKNHIELAFRSFLREFDLYFSAYLIHATPATLMIFLPILLVNTLGNIADKTRLLAAL
eukprot:Skav228069  [mRNA]  locus=scaffold52:21621:23525:+ [translate_table: standard]